MSVLHYSQQNHTEQSPAGWDKNPVYKPGKKELDKAIKRALIYTVAENFVINGVVTFALYIDQSGSAKMIDIKPKFKNDQLLLDDLNYVLRKTHKNWEAAQKDGKPVNSVYYYKINFSTDVYDHD